MFLRKISDQEETQMWLLKVTVETEKNAIEKFLEDQKSHIIPKLFKLLSATVKTTMLL